MTTIKTSYEEMSRFMQVSEQWLREKPENKNTKLGYAIMRVGMRITRLLDDYRMKAEDIDVDNCSVDDRNNVLKNDRGEYHFTKEALKKRNADRAKLFSERNVLIEPYIATKLPKDLNPIQVDTMDRFVLDAARIIQFDEEDEKQKTEMETKSAPDLQEAAVESSQPS